MRLSARARNMRSSEIRDLLRLAERPEVISLAGGLPDPGTFPTAAIADAVTHVLTVDPAAALQYSATDGAAELRAWIAARHTLATGRPTDADQVLVTTGSQQGLDLLARVLADPGDLVLAEDPAYLGALQAMRAAGLAVGGVALDEDGLDVDALHGRLTAGDRPRFVYTVPTFQNPTGRTQPAERRRGLAALADDHDLVLVEDAPYAELAFTAAPPAPLAAHSDRTVSLGTFSKTLAPGLRVGWVVGPEPIIAATARAKQAVDLHTSGLSQQVALDLVRRPGWYDAHVVAVAAVYAERATTLRAALVDAIGDRYELNDATGGMFLWASPRRDAERPPLDTRALLPVAVEHGTAFVPGAAFAVGEPTAQVAGSMRLSFATADPDDLRRAVDRLAAAIASVTAGGDPPLAGSAASGARTHRG